MRERFSCRECEAITQPPAPFHVIPRGHAGPNLLAMVLFEKYGQHQPLNRQSERYAREGIDLPLSTLADHVGACAAALQPVHALIERHVMAAERLHGDDTPVLFRASRDRSGDHPDEHLRSFTGILQADAYAGYNRLLAPDRQPGPIVEALSWAHARRKFFELADIATSRRRGRNAAPISPIAFEAVTRIDALFDIEREINGIAAEQRLAVRRERSALLVADLEAWMREHRAKLSRHAPVAQAMDYMLRRWDGFARFLGDGRICLTNNAAERSLRGLASAAKPGSSPDRTAAPSGPPSSTASSAPLNSTTSTRRPGSPTSSCASPTPRRTASKNFCHGTGGQSATLISKRPDRGPRRRGTDDPPDPDCRRAT